MKLNFLKVFFTVIIFFAIPLHSQDSVAVTFYYRPSGSVSIVYLPGSFNNWGNNQSGVISDSKFSMNYDGSTGVWYKTLKLLPGTYNYKFNENGNKWYSDPNNPLVNANDNNNSILNVTDPMIFYAGYDKPSDLVSPHYLYCNIFSSDNNPIIPDSLYIMIGSQRKSNLSSYWDASKKLLRYPTVLDNGTYKIKFFAKNAKGAVASDSITVKVTNAPAVKNLIPYEFILDPKSSYNSYKNLTSVNIPGVFNGWTPSSSPMSYDDYEGIWRKKLEFAPGEYEYKYYINNGVWIEDPDNPNVKSSTGNSFITINPIVTPQFKNITAMTVTDGGNGFTIIATIANSSYDIPIDIGSIKVAGDNVSLPFRYDTSSKRITLDVTGSLVSDGFHYIYFECTDSSGAKGTAYYSYRSGSENDGYNNFDQYSDELLPYPSYVPQGSADINNFNIKANSSLDSLTFKILMKKISGYTRLGFSVFNQSSGKFGSYVTDLNIHTVDWSDQGMFVILADPSSPTFDSTKLNQFFLSAHPISKGKKIDVHVKDNEFSFTVAVSDLDQVMGNYNGKRYYSLYSYICDETGADYKPSIEESLPNQPYVYDIAFASQIKQSLVINTHNQSRFARLDAEGRGIVAVSPEEIDVRLKSNGPIVTILTHSNSELSVSYKVVEGTVDDENITSVEIYKNDKFFSGASVSNKKFSSYILLTEGDNIIKAVAKNSSNISSISNSIKLTYVVDHSPKPVISFTENGNSISISASLTTDPDNDIDKYSWTSDDKNNPLKLSIAASGIGFSIDKPSKSGEYNFTLTVDDRAGNKAAVRNYFILGADGKISVPGIASNPQWVKDAIVYEIFVKSFSPEGNLAGITKQIDYLKNLGVNVLWLMPIMHNSSIVTENSAGYSIDDFYNIAPQFGTFSDYKTLVDSAHNNGIKVILDITQNHVADKHPWVDDIRAFGQYSNYYNFVERRKLGDDRGLGQTLNSDGIYMRYSNWSLANLNLENIETTNYLIKMFNWWLNEKNTDGFRYDVYWGPQNRYGKEIFWKPVRDALKKVKPDIFILGETDGTATGSETNYADLGGACDAAYDWNLYGTIKNIFGNRNLETLHNRITNFGYYPGDNSHFFRFLENHDEERCATFFNVKQNKAATALLLSVPGIPMIYMGQEAGWKGKRNQIDFNGTDASELLPFYRRMINARKKFPALRTKTINRLNSGDGEVYAFTRKYKDQNFVVIINFANSAKQITLNIDEANDLELTSPLSSSIQYYLNDFANDVKYKVKKDNLKNFAVSLGAYDVAVMLLSDKEEDVITAVINPSADPLPAKFGISQNYPNPFNPMTTIEYSIPEASKVKIVVYDILGREIKTLVDEFKAGGTYKVNFDAGKVSSGIYFYQLRANNFIETKKMVLAK